MGTGRARTFFSFFPPPPRRPLPPGELGRGEKFDEEFRLGSIYMGVSYPSLPYPHQSKEDGLDSPIEKFDGQIVLRNVRDRLDITLNFPPFQAE